MPLSESSCPSVFRAWSVLPPSAAARSIRQSPGSAAHRSLGQATGNEQDSTARRISQGSRGLVGKLKVKTNKHGDYIICRDCAIAPHRGFRAARNAYVRRSAAVRSACAREDTVPTWSRIRGVLVAAYRMQRSQPCWRFARSSGVRAAASRQDPAAVRRSAMSFRIRPPVWNTTLSSAAAFMCPKEWPVCGADGQFQTLLSDRAP